MSGRKSDAAPGTPRRARVLSALFLLSAGALAGRVARDVLPGSALGAFDLAIYVALALSVALAYRRFVRRTLIERRRERARRAGRRDGVAGEEAADDGATGDRSAGDVEAGRGGERG